LRRLYFGDLDEARKKAWISLGLLRARRNDDGGGGERRKNDTELRHTEAPREGDA
jgi:hypothetical protein